jgi:hypothetical protein
MKNPINIVHRVDELAFNGLLKNDEMVQLIEVLGEYLNLKTISDYAKENKMSYNGVKHHRKIITLFNNKYVIDND